MNVLHRITKQYIKSVSPASLPEALSSYIESPDLTAVDGFASKHWVITGDVISLMSQADRNAIDLADVEAAKDSTASKIDSDPYLRAFALVMLDEINLIRANASLATLTAEELKTAVRGKL